MNNKTNHHIDPFLVNLFQIFFAFAVTVFLMSFVFLGTIVPSGSMEPTIADPAFSLGNRTAYWHDLPQYGDIIFFKQSENPDRILVKRVIGLPGDEIEIIQGKVYRNGQLLDEPYLKETPNSEDCGPFTVPNDCVFVLGDNRNNSYDSRYWDDPYVPVKNIIAKFVTSFQMDWTNFA